MKMEVRATVMEELVEQVCEMRRGSDGYRDGDRESDVGVSH